VQGQEGSRIVYADSTTFEFQHSDDDKPTAAITIDIGEPDEDSVR
jgi:hypothetical protein